MQGGRIGKKIFLLAFLLSLFLRFPAPVGAVKLLALTFDDGPSAEFTPQIVSVLDTEKVKATFFMVGKWLPGKQALVRSLAADGQQIGNHTFDHVKLTDLKAADIRLEVARGRAALREVTGQTSFMVRPPFGARDQGVIAAIPAPVILWSVDPAAGKQVPGAEMARRILSRVRDGDIILLHDTTQANLDAVRPVIDALHGKGYEFVTVNELFRLRGVTPRDGTLYRCVSNPAPQDFDESRLADHWAYPAIEYMEEKGYMCGDRKGWHPNRYLSRAMAVTAIWRICGSPAPRNRASGFADVWTGQWYSDAVAWAKEQGLVRGKTETYFDLTSPLSREQLYGMVAGLPETLRHPSRQASSCPEYGDDVRIDAGKRAAVTKLRRLGFVSAYDRELFRPKDPATRAEAAELLRWFRTGLLLAKEP